MLETIGVIAIVALAGVTGLLLLWRQATGRGGGCAACKRPMSPLEGAGNTEPKSNCSGKSSGA